MEAAKSTHFNIEFTFDCDARCAITIHYFCTEDFTANGVVWVLYRNLQPNECCWCPLITVTHFYHM